MLTVFRERVKELRTDLGLSQPEFSERLGVGAGAVSLWERGCTIPALGTLMRICTEYDVSADWLLGLVDSEAPLAAGDSVIAKIKSRCLAEILRGKNDRV